MTDMIYEEPKTHVAYPNHITIVPDPNGYYMLNIRDVKEKVEKGDSILVSHVRMNWNATRFRVFHVNEKHVYIRREYYEQESSRPEIGG